MSIISLSAAIAYSYANYDLPKFPFTSIPLPATTPNGRVAGLVVNPFVFQQSARNGVEVRKPQNVIDSLISIAENVIVDSPDYFLLFLQDMFPYLEKYLMRDYLPKLVNRIEYTTNQMEQVGDDFPTDDNSNICNRVLLLDYKAELLVMKKDYKTALKKRQKAINIIESTPLNSEKADLRTVSLLSNLYNNLSNVYVLMKKPSDAAIE